MQELIKPHHFHDLGKLSLAFVMLWAYFNFSQFLLTYAANLIESCRISIARMNHGWQYLAIFLILFHFFVPFFLLLSRENKRASTRLVMVACWILFVRYVDIFMLVSPEFSTGGMNLHCSKASTPANSSCTGSTWRPWRASAASGCGCSRRSWRSGRCSRSATRTCTSRCRAQEVTDGPPSIGGTRFA
jgi:hypothetical protein